MSGNGTPNSQSNAPLPKPMLCLPRCKKERRFQRTLVPSGAIEAEFFLLAAAPRERYIKRRDYRDWDFAPRAVVGIRATGVTVGVGVACDRW
jgi:hypothetical protein